MTEKHRDQHDADMNEIVEYLESNNYHDVADQYRTLATRLSQKDIISCLNVHHMTKTFFLWKLRDAETRLQQSLQAAPSEVAPPEEPPAEQRELSLLNNHIQINLTLQAEIKRLEQENQALNADAMSRYNRKAETLKEFYLSHQK